ncbi:MAG: uridine kinase [Planctomycetes bacterium]|nr:uridine kinase [Planctomycetota bacterium]
MRSKPFSIGIAGGSGSGKTSLTRALVDVLGEHRCAVLDHDSYYRDLGDRPLSLRERTNFDHPDSLESGLLARHLHDLSCGIAIERPVYDFATHTRSDETRRVEARPVVICEGILLLSVPELRQSFDLRVFVDTPADVRALRRLRRDIDERGRTVQSVIQQYFDTVRPMHEQFVAPARRNADLILDWRKSAREQAQAVLEKLDRAVLHQGVS